MEPFQNSVPKPINKSLAKYPRKILPIDNVAKENAIRGVSSCALTK